MVFCFLDILWVGWLGLEREGVVDVILSFGYCLGEKCVIGVEK